MASKVYTVFLLYLLNAEQIKSFTISKWRRYSLKGYQMEDFIGEEKRRSLTDCMIKCNSYNSDCLITGFNILTHMCYIYNKFLYVTQNHILDSNMEYFIKHQGYCSPPFVSAESRCVYISNTTKYPDTARTQCETFKSSMILLDTHDDLRFIKENFPYLPGDFFLAAGANKFAGDLNSFEWLSGEIIEATLFCPGEPDRHGYCSPPFVSAESRCVYISNTTKYPDTARTQCETFKSSVILLDTHDDLRFIKENFPYLPGGFFLAAGANKFAGDLNSFEWLSGEIIEATLFCPGEPDRDDDEKSVGISTDRFCLKDRLYEIPRLFICEMI
ncbi:hypothetical protein LOTGIDRAFT_159034 [Lottia gigantea]|uniref:C-type lectin domain-containing protein n=1 Tax=Lottia gigantea TaxID=225164 RepID=V4C907_LOTGI|nr:hypothetical protein LOTGIDRAFT_159034 [Lottia gigantea]ESO98239.1 hypothetical protein LOTGIDRAFT_159034 [Lottia gigantea]